MRKAVWMVFMVVTCRCWAEQPPVPGTGLRIGQNYCDAKQEQQHPTIKGYGTDAWPAVVRLVPPELSDAETRKSEYEGNEKPTLDRWTFWVAFVSALTNIGLAIVTYRLWRDSRAAAVDSDARTRASLAIAKQAADAATENSNATTAANRSWIGCVGLDHTEDGWCKLRVKNFGVNPARNRLVVTVNDWLPNEELTFMPNTLPGDQEEFSTAIVYKDAEMFSKFPLQKFIDQHRQSLDSGEFRLILQALASYTDVVTGKEYQTRISYFYRPGKGFEFTRTFNDCT